MMRKYYIKIVGTVLVATCLIVGCGKSNDVQEEEPKPVMQEEAVPEEPVIVDSLSYTSVDERIQLELPNETWKCTEDTGTLITFTSDAGVINIMYIAGEGVADIQVPKDQAAYEAMLKGNFAEVQYEILEFESLAAEGRRGYQVVVAYDDTNPDKYTVGYGNYLDDEGYTVAATLTEDDPAVLEAVKKTIFEMQILD